MLERTAPHLETLADPQATAAATPMLPEDWDELFNAVVYRLWLLADEPPASGAPADPTASGLREGVRECAGALAQLHAVLLQAARGRHWAEAGGLESRAARAAAAGAGTLAVASVLERPPCTPNERLDDDQGMHAVAVLLNL